MKYVKYILITIVFIIFSSNSLLGQLDTTEYETYLYPELKEVVRSSRYIVETSSGIAYITLGKGNGVYMVKLNNEFEIEWHKQVFHTQGQTSPHSMYWDEDRKNYIITGTGWTHNDDVGYTTFCGFILKLDSLGNIVEQKIPKKYYSSFIFDAVVYEDKIFALYSEKESDPTEISTDYLSCYSIDSFELVWKKEVELVDYFMTSARRITKLNDGVVIYSRYVETEDDHYRQMIRKYDFEGSKEWEKDAGKFAGRGEERFVTTSNQTMLYTGRGIFLKSVLKKFDKEGNLLLDKTYDSLGESIPGTTIELKNGGYCLLIASGSSIFSAKTHILRVDSLNGEIKAEKTLSLAALNSIYDEENKNIILSGRTRESTPLTMIIPTESLNPVGIDDSRDEAIEGFRLYQNYPNPFNPITTIKYSISSDMFVNLSIYDITGKKLETIVDHKQYKGSYEKAWDGSNYPSGVYFYRMKTRNNVINKKMILVK